MPLNPVPVPVQPAESLQSLVHTQLALRGNRPEDRGRFYRLAASKTTHGRTTKAERAKAKYRADVGRQVRAELREIETWAMDLGHLSKDWRDQFK